MIKVEIPDREIRKLTADLVNYGDKQRKSAKDELHAAGLNVESGAKKMVPVDVGRLRSSIHMESDAINRSFSYSDNAGNNFDGSLGVSPSEMEVYVGTNVEYAPVIHRRGGKGGKGQGFLFVTAEQERVKLIRRLRQQLQKT